jgi:phage gp46-like protein
MALALEPIVDDGRASDIEVTAVVSSRTGVGLTTKITDARGEVEKLALQGLGV